MTHIKLPGAKGTYVLIVSVPRLQRVAIGRLGEHDIIPGFYAYVGSAFGPGGLRARLQHHLAATARPHWHIDYLLAIAEPVEVWCAVAGWKLEQELAEMMAGSSSWRMPIPRFGASDSHRSRASHLFYSLRRPSFRRFRRQVGAALGEPVELDQYRVATDEPRDCGNSLRD